MPKSAITVLMAALLASGLAKAQTAPTPLHVNPPIDLSAPLPPLPMPKGPTGRVDDVLDRISKNMQPNADVIDAGAEQVINRDLNISKTVGAALKPVGYALIGNQRYIYASDDGQKVIRLTEGSRLGIIKIAKISEYGVEYQAGGKNLYAPLSYTLNDPPKAPQQNQPPQATGGQPGQMTSQAGRM